MLAVKPKTRYRLTGYIKTKDVVVKGNGATLSLEGGFEHTESITGKQAWKKVFFEFDSGALASVELHKFIIVSRSWLPLTSLLRHLKCLAVSLCLTMKALMAARSASLLSKLAPRMALRVRMPNQNSTWLSQLAEVGVK